MSHGWTGWNCTNGEWTFKEGYSVMKVLKIHARMEALVLTVQDLTLTSVPVAGLAVIELLRASNLELDSKELWILTKHDFEKKRKKRDCDARLLWWICTNLKNTLVNSKACLKVLRKFIVILFGPHQANLVLIAYASSEGSGEPAHPRSLARTFAARS